MSSSLTSSGSLLRLFQCDYFSPHLHMHYLLTMQQSGVQDYLVNELYKMTDDDIDFYLPQLCQLALLRYKSSSLNRFLLDKAAESMHFALKIHWLVQSIVEDNTPELTESALAMVNACETAMVNSSAVPPSVHGRRHPRISHDRNSELDSANGSSSKRANSAPPDFLTNDLVREEHYIAQKSSLRLRCSSFPRLDGRWSEFLLSSDGEGTSGEPEQQYQDNSAASSTPSSPSTRRATMKHLASLSHDILPERRAQTYNLQGSLPNAFREFGEPVKGCPVVASEEDGMEDEMRQFLLKQRRCDYFNTQNHLVSMIMKLSTALTAISDKAERKLSLTSTLQLVNRWLFERRTYMALNSDGPLHLLGLHIPMLRKRDTQQHILRVHPGMCKIFSSATRAPFMLVYETADLDDVASDKSITTSSQRAKSCHDQKVSVPPNVLESLSSCMLQELENQGLSTNSARSKFLQFLNEQTPESWQKIRADGPPSQEPPLVRAKICKRCSVNAAYDSSSIAEVAPSKVGAGQISPGNAQQRKTCPACVRFENALKARQLIWGDSWESKVQCVRKASPFGHYNSWALNAVVVKGADDLRQELLAAQVIKQFISIFREANISLWLRDIEVLVTSSTSGIIEYISDSVSIDSMKKCLPGKSLAEIFKVAYADNLYEAKLNFIESCAAYSLVVWFLQVKDRHNGNLMLDSKGHVIHIDFGFMLSNSPGGNMAFEQSPFKLTQEVLDVMDGDCSDQYEYFRTLVIRGFLEARKQYEKIILPIQAMLEGSKMPCFREGDKFVLDTLQERFFIHLTEEACIEKIVDLIDSSVNNWRTIQYDNYQRLVNGIL